MNRRLVLMLTRGFALGCVMLLSIFHVISVEAFASALLVLAIVHAVLDPRIWTAGLTDAVIGVVGVLLLAGVLETQTSWFVLGVVVPVLVLLDRLETPADDRASGRRNPTQ